MLILVAVFFATSGVGVVTGSTSVITVPVMFQFGLDARLAVATNMFALTFMSIRGTLPFLRSNVVNRARLPLLIVLTLFGSAIGAALLLVIPSFRFSRFLVFKKFPFQGRPYRRKFMRGYATGVDFKRRLTVGETLGVNNALVHAGGQHQPEGFERHRNAVVVAEVRPHPREHEIERFA
jgi:hypothetical protein